MMRGTKIKCEESKIQINGNQEKTDFTAPKDDQLDVCGLDGDVGTEYSY